MRCRRTRFKSEVNYSGKLWALFLRRFRKVAASSFVFSKKKWRKNVSTKIVRVYRGLRYESTPFVLRQYYQFFKVKIYSGTDKLKTTKRQLELHLYRVSY